MNQFEGRGTADGGKNRLPDLSEAAKETLAKEVRSPEFMRFIGKVSLARIIHRSATIKRSRDEPSGSKGSA
jgi:hypothetical protein